MKLAIIKNKNKKLKKKNLQSIYLFFKPIFKSTYGTCNHIKQKQKNGEEVEYLWLSIFENQ